jgi:drug/metabolite transporter (DMT)-like permease
VSAADMAIVLLSALLHALWSVAIKGSRNPLAFNFLQLLVWLPIGAVLLASVDLEGFPPVVWGLLAATGVVHTGYFYWMSRAFESTDLSLAYPIARSTPAFLPLIAIPLFGEPVRPLGVLGIAVVVAGMWSVHAGAGLRFRALFSRGTVYAYLTLATTVAYGLTDKAVMLELHASGWQSAIPRAALMYVLMQVACCAFFGPLAIWQLPAGEWLQTARTEWKRVATAAAMSFASYSLILQALQTAPVSYVVAVRQVSVLFVVAMSVLWLGEKPSRLRIVGAATTVIGVALIGAAG